MNATITKLDCWGQSIWRVFAMHLGETVKGLYCVDFDNQDDAENACVDTARRNDWGLHLQIFYTPGKPAGSVRTIPAPSTLGRIDPTAAATVQ